MRPIESQRVTSAPLPWEIVRSRSTIAVLDSPTAVAPEPTSPALDSPSSASTISATSVLNPALGEMMGKVNPPSGVPRDQVTIPISPVPNPSDTIFFEQPSDPNQKLYLPRYRVLDQPPLQVTLAQGDHDWSLTVRLEKYRAPEIEQSLEALALRGGQEAPPTVAELPHSVMVIVRHNLLMGGTAVGVKELVFQEITADGAGLRVALRATESTIRDQLFLAMTDVRYGTVLIVRRIATLAVPTPAPAPASVVSAGDGVLHGTWLFSFDSGQESAGKGFPDVQWEQMTDVRRQLTPISAQVVNLGMVDFDALNIAQLESLRYSTTPIPGNADSSNQLVPGDVFAVHTSGGSYAKVKVLEYGYDLHLRWVTYRSSASGEGTLHGTWLFDFDSGEESSGKGGADVWWEQKTSVQRQLTPTYGQIVNLGQVDFETLDLGQLQKLAYGSVPIPGNADTTNQLVPGDVFAVHTSEGNYTKVQVLEYGYDLRLRWVNYNPNLTWRSIVYSDDERLQPEPFIFPTGPPVFINVGPSGQSFGLVRHDVDWKGRSYSYYQDLSQNWSFLHLPDHFKIARRDESPHVPTMSVQISALDGSIPHTNVTLTYAALPFTDPDRLAAAAVSLAPFVTASSLPPGVAGPILQAMQVRAQALSLSLFLPGTGPSAGEHPRPNAAVDLRAGISDSITMTLEDFQAIYAALFGNVDLFHGTVEVRLGASTFETEHVELLGRLADLAGAPPLDSDEKPDAASGGIDATLTNAIESPLEVDRLAAKLSRGNALFDASVQGVDFAAPIQLKPADKLQVLVAPVAGPVPGDSPLMALFDLHGVRVHPDPQAVWDTILNPLSPNSYSYTITLEVFKSAFAAPADKPEDHALEINVDFPQGHAVDASHRSVVQVTPSDFPPGAGNDAKVSRPVEVQLPIRDYVLNTLQLNEYRYQVTVVRPSGTVTGEPKTAQTGIVVIQ